MIQHIGVIYQDMISLGFLEGLKERLGCSATVIPPPGNLGDDQIIPLKKKRLVSAYFRRNGVDLIIRFTDADQKRWQDVQREEGRGFLSDFEQRVVCGVANRSPEDWLALDPK